MTFQTHPQASPTGDLNITWLCYTKRGVKSQPGNPWKWDKYGQIQQALWLHLKKKLLSIGCEFSGMVCKSIPSGCWIFPGGLDFSRVSICFHLKKKSKKRCHQEDIMKTPRSPRITSRSKRCFPAPASPPSWHSWHWKKFLGTVKPLGKKMKDLKVSYLYHLPLSTSMKKGVKESVEPNMAFQTISGAMTNSKGYVHMSSRPTCIIFVYVLYVYIYMYKNIYMLYLYTHAMESKPPQ